MKQAYFELRPTRPQLDRVMELLDTNRYSGKECERDEHHQGAKVSGMVSNCKQRSVGWCPTVNKGQWDGV